MDQGCLFDRAVVSLTGAAGDDPATFLQGLVTNDVSGPLPVWAALLSAQGKALFDFLVWPRMPGSADGALLLDCEAAFADDLVRRLSLYRLRKRIAIVREDGLAVYWQADGAAGTPDPRLPALGRRWIAPADPAAAPADAAWLRHRLSLGVAEGRAELGDTLWLEANAVELNGVSFTKGCYVGQENTARMNWRQKVNRRLLVVPLDRGDAARRRAEYPELGFAVDHLRVADIPNDLRPGWMAAQD
ncbi:YgfZ/GcvT domain-containing protein [Croceibacterium ferulae]|uniref:CAF17-like 4Fe-4S cluster assembly/insertion protein YgfZ n=1 Tax=Croceibacterium ferulae TaxID=1854641 RepID=UPI000EAD68B5|nr:folate-binding protein [Croceibacterium ferulae]